MSADLNISKYKDAKPSSVGLAIRKDLTKSKLIKKLHIKDFKVRPQMVDTICDAVYNCIKNDLKSYDIKASYIIDNKVKEKNFKLIGFKEDDATNYVKYYFIRKNIKDLTLEVNEVDRENPYQILIDNWEEEEGLVSKDPYS